MGARILVAEDDPMQAEVIRRYLERDGHRVRVVHDGRQALQFARAHSPDLLLLDVMMPDLDGLDLCRILRTESDVPILLVTARRTEDDKLLGLDIGADDYVTKPFSPRELAARVRALLRRAGKASVEPPDVRIVGDLEIDAARFEVRIAGRTVTLTATEFGILETLASQPGRAFTRAQIIQQAFGFDHDIVERTVDAHILNLRRKIEQDPAEPRYVQTVYGRGYRLAAPGSTQASP